MTYILHIWEHPLPASVAEADQIHTQLSAQKTAQNPKFIELAKCLTARHPCITTLDDEDPDAVWSDGPLDGKTERAVYSIGIQTDFLNVVVPFVVSTANALGLTVYDMQVGEAHLTNNVVLTLPGRTAIVHAEQASDEIVSTHQIEVLVDECIKEVLINAGFKFVKSKRHFTRKINGFTQEIYSHAYTYPAFNFVLAAGIEIEVGLDLYKNAHQGTYNYEFVEKLKKYSVGCWFEHFPRIESMLELTWPPESRFMVNTMTEVRKAATQACVYLSSVVVPVLNECTSIQAINSLMNTIPVTSAALRGSGDNGRYVQHLIIAHMISDKNFDALVSHIRGLANQYQSIYVESTLRSLGYEPVI
jgi:hypothetical protein